MLAGTCFLFRKELFLKFLEKDTSLMLFQLPSSLGVLSDQVQRPAAPTTAEVDILSKLEVGETSFRFLFFIDQRRRDYS